MQFIVEDAESHLNITVTEPRIDAAIATLFKDKLREIVVKNRKPVHMDMAAVDFMDSSGLGAMIAVRKSLPENLALVLFALRQIRRAWTGEVLSAFLTSAGLVGIALVLSLFIRAPRSGSRTEIEG